MQLFIIFKTEGNDVVNENINIKCSQISSIYSDYESNGGNEWGIYPFQLIQAKRKNWWLQVDETCVSVVYLNKSYTNVCMSFKRKNKSMYRDATNHI